MQWGRSYAFSEGFDLSMTANSHGLSTAWLKVPAGVANTTGDVDIVEPDDWTLVRSLAHYAFYIPGLSTGAVGVAGFGVIVWEGVDDTQPNPLEVPWPSIDGDADWIGRWIQPLALGPGSSAYISQAGASQLSVESKAQRKLSARQGILLVVDGFLVAGTGTVAAGWYFDYRALFKLP